MKKFTVKDLVLNAIIGALYFVLVFAFQFMSFGDIQFRIAEVLLILVLFNSKLSIGLLLGTFLANLLNPLGFGLVDAIFGTAASAIGIIGLILLKRVPILALLVPVIANGIIVSIMLKVMLDLPFFISFIGVSLGEAAVLYILALPTFYYLRKRDDLTELLN